MTDFYSWDGVTANNNGTADTTAGISIAENATPPSNVNNGMRGMMWRSKQVHDDDSGKIIGTGTANAHVVATANAFASYRTGVTFTFRPVASNTAASTMNANAVGIKAIRKYNVLGADVALTGGEMLIGRPYRLLYDTTANAAAGAFLLLNPEPIAGDQPYSPNARYNLTISNNVTDVTNDIDIAAGSARDSTNAANIDLLAAITGKQLDVVWGLGPSAGMRASGAAIADGTYHVFVIKRPDTGVVDVAADTSVTGVNIPANTNAAYTVRRRIGSIIRTGGAIIPFLQDDKRFTLKTPETTVAATNPGTSAVTRTMQVPAGIRVGALLNIGISSDVATTDYMLIVSDLSGADVAPAPALTDLIFQSPSTAGAYRLYVPKTVMTDTSRQVRTRLGFSSSNTQLRIMTYGWEDISL